MACGCTQGELKTLVLDGIIKHNENTYSFDFKVDQELTWNEGDSSKLFIDVNGEVEGRKFSYASLKEEGIARFTTRIKSLHSDYKDKLLMLKPGDQVEISKPSGSFNLRRDSRPIILLSQGVGIATMRSLIKAFEKDATDISGMVQINVDSHKSIYEEEMAEIDKKTYNFKSIYVSHRDEFYETIDFEGQSLMFKTGMIPYFYVVGSDDFILDVTGYIMSVGFDYRDIITDGFSLSGGCGCSSGGGCGCQAS